MSATATSAKYYIIPIRQPIFTLPSVFYCIIALWLTSNQVDCWYSMLLWRFSHWRWLSCPTRSSEPELPRSRSYKKQPEVVPWQMDVVSSKPWHCPGNHGILWNTHVGIVSCNWNGSNEPHAHTEEILNSLLTQLSAVVGSSRPNPNPES